MSFQTRAGITRRIFRCSVLLLVCSIAADAVAQQSNRQAGRAPTQRRTSPGASAGSARTGSVQTNGRSQTFSGRQLQSGSFNSRSSQLQSSPRTGQNPQQQNTSRRRGQTSMSPTEATRTFTQNAMRFDQNHDDKLAAHELRNLFIVLTTQMQQQTVFNNTTSLQQRLTTVPVNTGPTYSSGGTPATQTGSVPQGLAIRQAIVIFLQLVMQFDLNGDGLLSQAELNQFAAALLQNDMDLTMAAAQQRLQSNRQPRSSQPTTSSTVIRRSGGSVSSFPRVSQQQFQSVQILQGSQRGRPRDGRRDRPERDTRYSREMQNNRDRSQPTPQGTQSNQERRRQRQPAPGLN